MNIPNDPNIAAIVSRLIVLVDQQIIKDKTARIYFRIVAPYMYRNPEFCLVVLNDIQSL